METEYEPWNSYMSTYGYEYEAFEVTTEDGYIETLFHITGKTSFESIEPTSDVPVLIINGWGTDASSWFELG